MPHEDLYAGVVLPLPLDTVFTYSVPPALRGGRLAPGSRVRVPFGKRTETGFVVETGPSRPSGSFRIRPILAALDPAPVITPPLMRLARWMSRFYYASLGETLAAVAPPAVSGSAPPRYSVLLAVPPERARSEADEIRRRAVRQARVLDFLTREPGPHPHPLVLKRCGCTLDVLRALSRKGLLLLSPVETTAFDLPTGHDPGAVPASLTSAQREALEAVNSALDARSFRPFLLHGVTGSGKTEVYLRALSHAVANGGRGIVLVPEIALTPQTVARFQARFPRLAVLHSAMPAGYRRRQWELAAAGKADVVIGARSAVFAPLPSLSLIVVDEEHEPSYKQENPPRYHAREVALMRGRFEDAVVLLGSATPSLESYRNAREGRFTLLRLPERVPGRVLPRVEVVDMREERRETKRNVLLSRSLEQAVREALEKGGQVLLFLNRRGFHVFCRCMECGAALRCPNCDITLTYHKKPGVLSCHYCGHREPVASRCPECGAFALSYAGTGTERVEDTLAALFPGARIRRMDADTTTRRNSHGEILGAFRRGETDILVGTQMIAKGLDYPNITVVGVLDADLSLVVPDFRSFERTFQLLAQVAGRTGRGESGGRVIIQTSRPDLPAVRFAAAHDYESFARSELEQRMKFGYPPYSRLCRLLARSVSAASAKDFLASARALLADRAASLGVSLLGPVPAPLSRIEGKYRYHMLMKSPGQRELLELTDLMRLQLRPPGDVTLAVDMNPVSLL